MSEHVEKCERFETNTVALVDELPLFRQRVVTLVTGLAVVSLRSGTARLYETRLATLAQQSLLIVFRPVDEVVPDLVQTQRDMQFALRHLQPQTNSHLLFLHEQFGEGRATRLRDVVELVQVCFSTNVHQEVD